MFTRIALLLLVSIGLVACNRDNFSAERNPAGGVDITVTATESEINTSLSTALAQSPNAAIRNASIDLQANQLVISGEVERQNGSGEYVDATFTVQFSIVDGRLSAEITDANVAGWSGTDARLADINQQIESALQGRAQRDNPNVKLTALVITDTNLTFTLNAQRAED